MSEKLFRFIVTSFIFLWTVKEILIPVSAAALYSQKFMELAVACDTAMENSWYYRQDDRVSKNSEIVELLNCHDYDKTRKVLKMSGLPEDYLAWLGLRSLEIYQRPASEYVEAHRFKER